MNVVTQGNPKSDLQNSQTSEMTKYEIALGRVLNGTLNNPMLAGFAVQFAGEQHYVLRFTMFPNIPYYLCKNRDSQTQYTAFAKIVRDPNSSAVRFQNPIGSGKLQPDLKSHLENRFPLVNSDVVWSTFT